MVLPEIAALYAGANILILLVLAMLVSRRRRAAKVSLGHGGDAALERAIRAHANAAEYVPAALAGLVLLAMFAPATPVWLMHACGASLTLGRALHGAGLNASEINLGRMLGTALTWACYLLLGASLIYLGFGREF